MQRSTVNLSEQMPDDVSIRPHLMADDAAMAANCLKHGNVILYPTDTVWGIGCDATNSEAIKRIYTLKQRADNKAMIVLVDSLAMLERYVEDIPEVAYQLIEASVRPLTIVYDKATGLAPELLGTDGSVGVRVCADSFCKAMIGRYRKPVVSTSANISGRPAPAIFTEIAPEIIAGVDYVAHWRRTDSEPARPSSVIKLGKSGLVQILRP